MFSRIVENHLRGKREEEMEEKINTILQVVAGCADLCLSLLKNKKRNKWKVTELKCVSFLEELKKFLEEKKKVWGLFPWQEMRRRERLKIKEKLQKVILKAPGMQELQEEVTKIIEYIEEATLPTEKE